MNLTQAEKIAQKKLDQLMPFCERGEIAGSVRRRKEDCGDIELVVIPKMIAIGDLFDDNASKVSALDLDSSPTRAMGKLLKNGEKYKQIELADGINIDLFIVTHPAQWGVIFALRTGNAFFSNWLVTNEKKTVCSEYLKTFLRGALPYFSKVESGAVWEKGKIKPMPEEIDFLNYCGVGWVEPSERNEIFVQNFFRTKE